MIQSVCWMPAFAGMTTAIYGTAAFGRIKMAIYTVHEPPLRKDETEPDPNRFVFVRDGFYLWGFLLTPLWMLRYRLWLVLVGYILLTIALSIALYVLRASPAVTAVASLFVAFLAGLEGGTLRRWTLARRGFRPVGIVVGDDVDSAERRFFDSWVRGDVPSASAAVPPVPPPLPHQQASGSGVLGLFPQPGAAR